MKLTTNLLLDWATTSLDELLEQAPSYEATTMMTLHWVKWSAEKLRAQLGDSSLSTRETGKRSALGYFLPAIPAHASVIVVARPQRAFEADQLLIPKEIAPHFAILDLRVGHHSQMISAEEIPADVFASSISEVDDPGKQAARQRLINFDRCKPGMDLAITIRNLTKTPHDFRATLLGEAFDE